MQTDLRTTESFLLNQEGVLDASVWFAEGDIVANIVVYDGMSVQTSSGRVWSNWERVTLPKTS
jgi:hypothetical protein